MNLDECEILERLQTSDDLHKFDMNKILDSDDEVNMVKRRPRTKDELNIVRPWQNLIMARFLDILFKENAETGYLLKSTVTRKFNESGVPVTWPRMASVKTFFEKKTMFPPWAPTKKVTVVLPLHDADHNIRRVEECVINMIIKKIDKELDKFLLPIRIADVQKEY